MHALALCRADPEGAVAHPQFDPTLKDLVEGGPRDWVRLAGLPAGATRLIDADIATVSGAADKVLWVETERPYLLHLEFLSGHDAAEQPRKLHKRNLLPEDRHDLDVRTLLVVLRPEADSPVLTGLRQRAFHVETEPCTTFRYAVLRVWQVSPDVFLTGGLGTLPLTPIGTVTPAELPGILDRMQERLRSRRRSRAQKLWATAGLLMGLRYPEERIEELLRGVVAMKESTVYQAAVREGMAQGEAKGLAQGALAEARKLVLIAGESHFGPADAQVKADLEHIDEVERLEAMMARHQQAADWQDLLATKAPLRRNGRRRSSS
jgi:predicted transposase YdaD